MRQRALEGLLAELERRGTAGQRHDAAIGQVRHGAQLAGRTFAHLAGRLRELLADIAWVSVRA
ncbi:hypothetical protein BHX98_20610 [Acinetobacter baumannii]|nr:hypothetical protein BHX98_20610 [Acinetobacter baumannii]